MRLVIDQFKIVVAEINYIVHLGIDFRLWRRQVFSFQLQVRLVQVV